MSVSLRLKSAISGMFLASRLYNTSILKPKFKVLAYHRIIDPEELGYPIEAPMFVRPKTFEMHCQILRKYFNVIPLSTLLNAIEKQKAGIEESLPPNAVVITFDDGWIDNYQNALEILKRQNLPASVFLTTSYIGTNKLFWSDYYAQSRRGYSQEQLLNELNELKRKDRTQRLKIIEQTISDAQAKNPAPQFLNWEQIREMHSAGIEFGSHTHSHVFLDELESPDIHRELKSSFEAMEKNQIPALNCLCYPNGFCSQASHEALREFGVKHAIMTTSEQDLTSIPTLLGRTCIHETISSSPSLFLYHLCFS